MHLKYDRGVEGPARNPPGKNVLEPHSSKHLLIFL